MFAISYALIIANILSCIPSLPAVLFPVDGEKFHATMERFFDKMPNEMDQPLLKLLMKFQFGGLTFLYLLGAFAGYFCPTVIIGCGSAGLEPTTSLGTLPIPCACPYLRARTLLTSSDGDRPPSAQTCLPVATLRASRSF